MEYGKYIEYMKSRTGRMISWMVLNLGLLFGLIIGTVYELDGALNIILFILWIFTILSWVNLIDNIVDEVIKKNEFLIERPYPVPELLFWGYDLVLLAVIVYTGHFLLAVAYVIALIGQVNIYKRIEELRNSSEKYI